MNAVNEGSTAYITVTFRDKDGVAQAPVAAQWMVIDRGSRQILKDWEEISPAESVELVVPTSVNTLQNQRLPVETRRVIVKAQYGANDAISAQFDYRVVNMSELPEAE